MWEPANLDFSQDGYTWEYTAREKHFMPTEGLVPSDAKFIVDLGCNAGLSTGIFADTWKESTVLGIDMDENAVQRAISNVSNLDGRVFIHCAAVGWPQREQRAVFPKSSAVNYLDGYYPANEDFFVVKDVSVVSLDFVLESHGFHEKQIDFMKIDIEGSEWEVIFDGGKWPERTKCMVVEIHTNRSRQEFEDQMRNLGFSISYNASGQTIGTK